MDASAFDCPQWRGDNRSVLVVDAAVVEIALGPRGARGPRQRAPRIEASTWLTAPSELASPGVVGTILSM